MYDNRTHALTQKLTIMTTILLLESEHQQQQAIDKRKGDRSKSLVRDNKGAKHPLSPLSPLPPSSLWR